VDLVALWMFKAYSWIGNGWIGSQFKEILQVQGKKVVISNTQIESREQVMKYISLPLANKSR
jgi:predicted dinucleotide-binding enzyme